MASLFEQWFDDATSTYTYGLADAGEALLIDPVLEYTDTYIAWLKSYDLRLEYVLDTHVHADHITAAGALRKKTDCETCVSVHAAVGCADLFLRDGAVMRVGDLRVQVLETPGHTPTCLSFYCEDKVFTGDALLIDGCGRTDFQGGDAGRLYDSITQRLFTLPDDTKVYPGHDYHGRISSTILEQKTKNPRLTQTREAFVDLMQHLDLPKPKRIEEAVPANQACGQRI